MYHDQKVGNQPTAHKPGPPDYIRRWNERNQDEMDQQWQDVIKGIQMETTGTNLKKGEVIMPSRKVEMEAAVAAQAGSSTAPSIYEPKYTSNVTGGTYEGSNMEIMQKVIQDKMASNVSSGKYEKKGLFGKTRGWLEKGLDRRAGGDWDPMIGTSRTRQDLKGKISKQLGKKETAYQNEQVQSLADKIRQEQRVDTEKGWGHLKDIQQMGINAVGNLGPKAPEYFTPPDYNALDDYGKGITPKEANFPQTGIVPNNIHPENKSAFDQRISQTSGRATPENLRNNQIQDLAKSQIPFTGRFKANSQDGNEFTAYSDNKNMFYKNNESPVLSNSNGESIGYSSGPGKFHFQEPDQKQLSNMGMTQDQFYQPNGNIFNKDMSNNQSALYGYGGQSDVPMVGKKSGPYANENQSVAQNWKGGPNDPSRYFDKYGGGPQSSTPQAPQAPQAPRPTNLMQQKEQEMSPEQWPQNEYHRTKNPRPIGATPDEELMSNPLMQMDLGGAKGLNKDMDELGMSYWDKFRADAVGPGSWGWRGKAFNPQKGYRG